MGRFGFDLGQGYEGPEFGETVLDEPEVSDLLNGPNIGVRVLGFGEERIGTEIVRHVDIGAIARVGEHNHRKSPPCGVAADPAEDLKTVHSGHFDVQGSRVGTGKRWRSEYLPSPLR
jgi:hypothetical protein